MKYIVVADYDKKVSEHESFDEAIMKMNETEGFDDITVLEEHNWNILKNM